MKNTTHKVVLPFYVYAALSFLAATVLLLFSVPALKGHYFHPHILSITHILALGWGTMIILGASHQLVPVLVAGRLYSERLAYLSFVMAAAGIPLLAHGFYLFNMGWATKLGGLMINAAILIYLVNIAMSIMKSKNENVHAIFVFTAAVWLLVTTIVGTLLVFNFSAFVLQKDSVHYLSLHAHMGIAGWFLLLVTGVGSRLIPMFLISKYSGNAILWSIYTLINGGLLAFIILFFYFPGASSYLLPLTAVLAAIILFGYYCYRSYKQRIRRQVDEQVKISLLSVGMMLLPAVILFGVIGCFMTGPVNARWVLLYGFLIFFGWLTSIILGMTFKTLPFIIWNKVYHLQAGHGKTPNPKDLFSKAVFSMMCIAYLPGLVLFIAGIAYANTFLLRAATALLTLTAIFYNWNVMKLMFHQPARP